MITADGVSVDIGGRRVLKDITFKTKSREKIAILGPSGAGKTTLLRCICGVQQYDGNIFYNGININKTKVHKRNFGYVSQEQTLFGHMRVYENLAFPLKIRNFQKSEIEKIVGETSTAFSIRDLLYSLPQSLSGGEYQKVAIARSFIYNPTLILMDEPFAQLDPVSKFDLIVWLKKQLFLHKTPIFYVTHYLREAIMIADKILFICGGRKIFFDKPENFRKSNIPEIRNFIKKSI